MRAGNRPTRPASSTGGSRRLACACSCPTMPGGHAGCSCDALNRCKGHLGELWVGADVLRGEPAEQQLDDEVSGGVVGALHDVKSSAAKRAFSVQTDSGGSLETCFAEANALKVSFLELEKDPYPYFDKCMRSRVKLLQVVVERHGASVPVTWGIFTTNEWRGDNWFFVYRGTIPFVRGQVVEVLFAFADKHQYTTVTNDRRTVPAVAVAMWAPDFGLSKKLNRIIKTTEGHVPDSEPAKPKTRMPASSLPNGDKE